MNIQINGQPHQIAEGATVADAVTLLAAQPPYAAAVNREFVPRSQHAAHLLHEGDQVEIIRPVTGG
ncbi:sulfur carrier protein ThiS [Xenophilus arseniciresistens]|uniref:Sulfur carrier protein ThiS n=1 Tax=Xenophilus arseniciresistens TaxID=1283306 RepID=A0AAE3N6N6_9BURK|nr:sulfur carrier protein ThiS [Xenophilus arseniciresistens]MDA7415316.1 sulfur carrier protein ThiS [Xenophilus arseniciresistens]